jgi:glycosyltransferase involved in cell wall biosynthesis
MTAPPVVGVLLVDVARAMGGVETRVVYTACGLRDRGVAVRVACLAGSPVAAALRGHGIPVDPLAKVKWDPRLLTSLRRVLRALPGWLVDAHNAPSQLAVHLTGHHRVQGDRVATIHSEYGTSERRLCGFSWHVAVLRWTIRAGWALVPVSTSVRRDLEARGVAPDRMRLVWSGVATRPGQRSRAAVRAELGLDDSHFVIAAVGRLVLVKNFALAIEATALVHDTVPAARLVVVGDGPERAHLERVAAQHEQVCRMVRFVGHRQDVTDLLGAADVLVITSTTEGLPYVLLEAAAAHLPVISTAVGAIPEMFGDESVVLLPPRVEQRPEGAALLAAALAALARGPARRDLLASRAAAIQDQHLSVDAMVRSTLTAYALGPDGRERQRESTST